MSEAKHTPGPWRVNFPSGASAVVADTPASAFQGGEDYYNGHLIAESIAPENLPVIVAAPDLLTALMAMVAIHGSNEDEGAARKLAYAAIAKATGQ